MQQKIKLNYDNYIKYLKDNEFKLNTSDGIMIDKYREQGPSINMQLFERVLFSLYENIESIDGQNHYILYKILILRYCLDENDNFFIIKM